MAVDNTSDVGERKKKTRRREKERTEGRGGEVAVTTRKRFRVAPSREVGVKRSL